MGINTVAVHSEPIPNLKIREILIEALQKRDLWQNIDKVSKVTNTSQKLTELQTKLSKSARELMLTHQLIDMKTNKIIWSGSYTRPLVKTSQWPKLGSIINQ